jgi:hypothetical protein
MRSVIGEPRLGRHVGPIRDDQPFRLLVLPLRAGVHLMRPRWAPVWHHPDHQFPQPWAARTNCCALHRNRDVIKGATAPGQRRGNDHVAPRFSIATSRAVRPAFNPISMRG